MATKIKAGAAGQAAALPEPQVKPFYFSGQEAIQSVQQLDNVERCRSLAGGLAVVLRVLEDESVQDDDRDPDAPDNVRAPLLSNYDRGQLFRMAVACAEVICLESSEFLEARANPAHQARAAAREVEGRKSSGGKDRA